ncbi:DEKNAAC101138 [Brettanomyces naardenensis]|uniref:3-methyl-2-oxobutanoate hydroxymethyltransferase n=1 Tax=Brettanomyces naardenensis TaxID=13370 RepID=A0A448YHH7_BRENA|nr:DEKNAAC101138 [Brettanomyces naardenensis]
MISVRPALKPTFLSSRTFFRQLYSRPAPPKQATLADIHKKYRNHEPITVVTAHDFITGSIADAASQVDMILIGDSLSMTSKGYNSTLEIPFDEFDYACRSVMRGVDTKFVIADMPFGSVESSDSKCIESAVKLMSIGKIGSVKIEGGIEMAGRIRKLCELGIPVTGHVGLQPQKFNSFGGYKVQGKTAEKAVKIYRDALALQEAGCCMIVLECVPHKISKFITEKLEIPTIGIGSGKETSGQVLVFSDLLGMIDSKTGKFVKQYMNFHKEAVEALNSYGIDVKGKSFPEDPKHAFTIADSEYDSFLEILNDVSSESK